MKHVPMQAAPLTLRILNEFLEHLDLNKPKDATFWVLILICIVSPTKYQIKLIHWIAESNYAELISKLTLIVCW